jgi:hypothetical protein
LGLLLPTILANAGTRTGSGVYLPILLGGNGTGGNNGTPGSGATATPAATQQLQATATPTGTPVPGGGPGTFSIGDRVWRDANADGIYNPVELGVPGITVTLWSASGTQLAQSITSATGYYLFEGLTNGDYEVHVAPSAGLTFTTRNVSNNSRDAIDSDFDARTGRAVVTVSNDDTFTIDAGLVALQ